MRGQLPRHFVDAAGQPRDLHRIPCPEECGDYASNRSCGEHHVFHAASVARVGRLEWIAPLRLGAISSSAPSRRSRGRGRPGDVSSMTGSVARRNRPSALRSRDAGRRGALTATLDSRGAKVGRGRVVASGGESDGPVGDFEGRSLLIGRFSADQRPCEQPAGSRRPSATSGKGRGGRPAARTASSCRNSPRRFRCCRSRRRAVRRPALVALRVGDCPEEPFRSARRARRAVRQGPRVARPPHAARRRGRQRAAGRDVEGSASTVSSETCCRVLPVAVPWRHLLRCERNVTRIVAPCPMPWLSAWMVPPDPITKFAAECRPSPLPFLLVV